MASNSVVRQLVLFISNALMNVRYKAPEKVNVFLFDDVCCHPFSEKNVSKGLNLSFGVAVVDTDD